MNRRNARLALLLPPLVLAGCQDRELPTAPAAPEAPGLVISDAPRGGTAGFYFLPPMVSDPGPFSEPFDDSRTPTAHVCLLSQAPCTSQNSLASFSTGGSGAAAITVDLEGQSYNALWHTPANLTLGKDRYRLEVYEGAVRLGYADLWVVSKQQDIRGVTSDYVGLVRGSPFPIKFRLEGEPPPQILAETITAGNRHSCGLTASGAAYCWGFNLNLQLGDGTATDRHTPVAVQMPAGVTFQSISAGSNHTVALSPTGAAYAWGGNASGQLGDGTATDRHTPVAVQMPAGVTFQSISTARGSSHTVALSPTGAAYAWGWNPYGQLGDGTTTNSHTPVAVQMPEGVTFQSISAGHGHTVALSPTGAAYAWGYNSYGQLGDGTAGFGTNRNTPVAVQMPAGVAFQSISAGSRHTVALSPTGAAYAWGANFYGQLGDGTWTDRATPVAVQMPVGITFRSISVGMEHTVALSPTGAAYAWGWNLNGQLGDGTYHFGTNRNTPVPVQGGITFQ